METGQQEPTHNNFCPKTIKHLIWVPQFLLHSEQRKSHVMVRKYTEARGRKKKNKFSFPANQPAGLRQRARERRHLLGPVLLPP